MVSREIRRRFVAILLISLFLLTLAPSSLSRSVAQNTCPSNLTLTLALYGGSPNSFNMLTALPVAGTVSSLLQFYQMYPPPTMAGQLDYNESVIDWYSHNANYSQWTFNVKPNLKWSNGQTVNSTDILNTYSSSFALNPGVDFVNAAAEIKSESALNSSAAVFNLNISDAIFPEKVGSSLFTPVMPSTFTNNATFDGFGIQNVVVGPFYASNYPAGTTQGVFLRNPYFNPHPNACELLMQYFETDSSIPTYIASGQVDFGPVPPASVPSLLTASNVHVIDQKSLIPEMLAYNITTYPYNNLAFRQALLYGTNLTLINQQGDSGYGQIPYSSEGGIPPAATKWYNSNQVTYNYNVTKAQQLLTSIGIVKGSDGYLQNPKTGTDFTLTIWYDNSFAENAVAMADFQSYLQALGFKVVLNAASLGTLITDSYGNVNGINSAMIYFKSIGAIYGYAWTAGLPSYKIDIPFNAPPGWVGAPGSVVQNEFDSNLTALQSTDNTTLEYQYLSNIQALNSANLPVITFGYGDALWAYNTLKWTNWPSSLVILPNTLNSSALAALTPVGTTTSTTSGTGTGTTSVTGTSTSSGTGNGSSNSLLYAGVAVVVIIVAAVIAFTMLRGRGRKPAEPKF